MTDMVDELRPCGDCGVQPGQAHEDGCDVARCMWDGGQRLQCGLGLAAECCRALNEGGKTDLAEALADYLGLDDPDHDCGSQIWTGIWPGELECREYDLWTRWGPDTGERGWIKCDRNHPGAREDLNSLVMLCEWDREQQKMVLRK